MEIRKRGIGNNGSVDISVVAIMTNVSRRLIYLEKEVSFSRDLLFFFPSHNLTFYSAAIVILFFFSFSFSVTLYKPLHVDNDCVQCRSFRFP